MNEEPFELPPDIAARIPLFAELSKVLSWRGGPVNWDLARQLAVAIAATEQRARHTPAVSEEEVAEAFRLAELWIEETTELPPPPRLARVRVLTAAGFAEYATGALRELIDPLAARVGKAIGDQPLPEMEAGMLGQALAQLAPMFLGIQSGVVIGALSHSVLSQYDLALPVGEEGTATFVWPAVHAAAEAAALDAVETRLYVALHETAHRLEFEALPWVRAHFFALYLDYIAALQIDLSGAMDRLQQMDLTNPERLQEALGEQGVFGLVDSPGTQRALRRLQHLLALLEAYADRAVAAAGVRLSSSTRIGEALRDWRAAEGKGTRLFQRFLGLEIPAERMGAADVFTGVVLSSGGWSSLNRMWDETDNLPTAEELEAPETWLRRIGA